MAPATHPGEKPRTDPMLMKATPMVAMVDHELPVSMETTAHTMQDTGRKCDGLRISRP